MDINGKAVRKYLKKFIVAPEKKIRLKNFETGWVQHESFRDKPEGVGDDLLKEILEKDRKELFFAQELLVASHQ